MTRDSGRMLRGYHDEIRLSQTGAQVGSVVMVRPVSPKRRPAPDLERSVTSCRLGLALTLLLPVAAAHGQIARPDSARSHVIPALEIVGFDVLLNLFDRAALGDPYRSNLESMRRNLRSSWVIENDPFEINQFGHPYLGSIYHGFARASGQDYWAAMGYTFAGSVLWEIAGEVTPPSRNDQIASGIAGSFLGEALFRIGSLLLENEPSDAGLGRRMLTTAIAPTLVFNRRVFGRRFDAVFPSREAAYFRRIAVGATATTQGRGERGVRLRPVEGVIDVSMEYGLPGGETDYRWRRPFDYFALQVTGSTAAGFESALIRGLLVGRGAQLGSAYRGVWGLYGNYDYISPELFRVSSTAVSIGTTFEWRPPGAIAVQGTALAGAGFAAVGTLAGLDTADYHYGVAPHSLLASRIIFRDRAALDLAAREYFVSRIAGTSGHDNIFRLDAAFALRLHGQRAVAVRYVLSRRDSFFPGAGNRAQVRGTLGLFYTMLGHDRFGRTR